MSVMKTPVNGPERAITLFRDVDFCYASGLSFRVVYLIPVKHQNDVGIRTDVLDCCPKAEGMMMLIRAMSPDVVAVDEIGTGEDIRAIESVVNCGCKLLATVHGNSMEDMKQKPLLNRLVESHVFERYIVLDAKPHAGSVQAIFDGRGTTLYRREAFL